MGFISTLAQVGLYDINIKFLSIITPLVTSLSAVIQPRIANIYAKGDDAKIKEYTTLTIKVMLFLTFPLIAILIGISDNLVQWLFKGEFLKLAFLIKITSPIILFLTVGSIFGTQILIPTGKEKDFTISLVIGAVVNVYFNFLLIPKYGAVGGCIAYALCQLSVSMYQFFVTKKYINLEEISQDLWKYLVGAVIVFVSLSFVDKLQLSHLCILIVHLITAVLVYILATSLLKTDINIFLASKVSEFIRGREKELNENINI